MSIVVVPPIIWWSVAVTVVRRVRLRAPISTTTEGLVVVVAAAVSIISECVVAVHSPLGTLYLVSLDYSTCGLTVIVICESGSHPQPFDQRSK